MKAFIPNILSATKAISVVKTEHIQSLWSNYGAIVRIYLRGSNFKSVVAKHINFNRAGNHPRGWDTYFSHQRKVTSYEIECNWYRDWANKCNETCYVPTCLGYFKIGEQTLLLLEDLDDAGFPMRKEKLTIPQAMVVLSWLANFHATFMQLKPTRLWDVGTYWHLATRPDEFKNMEAGALKNKAKAIDDALNNCTNQTIVHGDAKVANFCFNRDLTQVSAVDFQYVGGGCGMKDVVYFLGSCLDAETCKIHEETLLNHYFSVLNKSLTTFNPTISSNAVEEEYRSLYAIAWTDFTRFLMGWMPTHQKLNEYSTELMQKAIKHS